MPEEIGPLRARLIQFVRQKFYSRRNIADQAEEIVDQAFLDVMEHQGEDKLNFGYLARASLHNAYRLFKQQAQRSDSTVPLEDFELVSTDDVVSEIIQAENTKEILDSLETLRQIEKVVLLQRYYGNYSFAEIARQNGLKLNTVLSHHRRALEKLRTRLSDFFPYRSEKPALPPKKKISGFSNYF